jgi:hypothetical protein
MGCYFSLQYSAIQATILRHDRLWSMAGISQALSELNEITLPKIAGQYGGRALVAGGGKFTARFETEAAAKDAGWQMVKAVSTAFPMLEFQYSEQPRTAATLKEALTPATGCGLVEELNEKKRGFRGGGLSFNPHLAVCGECGEYPAAEKEYFAEEVEWLCSYCKKTRQCAKTQGPAILDKDENNLITIEKIYKKYFDAVKISQGMKIPLDFADMVGGAGGQVEEEKEGRGRMAVWFSDINNMNDKVPIWIDQDEGQIFSTFELVKQAFIAITAKALIGTFDNPDGHGYLPFRIIVAGGDDLCIAMSEKYVLDFALNLSAAVKAEMQTVNRDPGHPLNPAWLERKKAAYDQREGRAEGSAPKPYSFGAAFVITNIQTPFARIHQLGEELMRCSKDETDRQANSVNWRIMAEQEAVSEDLLEFGRPVFIDDATISHVRGAPWSRMTFKDYLEYRRRLETISGSHRFQVVSMMIQWKDNPAELTRQLKIVDSAETVKSFSKLFNPPFYDNGLLNPQPIATVFELMSIERIQSNESS